MNLDTFLDATFNTKLCLTLLHSVWQVLILATVAAGLDRFSRRRSVERSYLLHTVALGAALMLLPVTYLLVDVAEPTTLAAAVSSDPLAPAVAAAGAAVPLPTSTALNAPPSAQETAPIALADGPAVAPPPSIASPPSAAAHDNPSVWSIVAAWIAGLYAAGVVVMLIRLWRGFWQADRLVATAVPLQDGPIAGLLQSLAREWSLRAVPALSVAERIVVPQVVGLLRPTILLPASALTGLSTDELRMILAHELAHIRRHDLWINLLQRLAETVLFFNPALWYLSRRISTLREFCCDEQICRSQTERESDLRTRYATALLHVAELSQRPPREPQPTDLATLAAAGRSPSELRRRIAHLFGEPMREPLRLSRGNVLTLSALSLLLFTGPAVWQSRSDSTSTHSDEAEESGRVLTFPEDRTLGVVYVRPAETSDFGYDGNWYEDWVQLASARGKVVIPDGQHVRLDVSRDASIDLRPLSELPPDGIQALWLRGTDVTDDELKYVGHLDGLKFLDLEQTKISDAGIQHLSDLHELLQLKLSAFNVHREGFGVGDGAMTVVAQLPALESIDLRLTKVTDVGLADLAKCKTLRNVGIEGTPVTDDGLKHLLKLPDLTWLSLGVYDDGANVTDAGMETIAQLTGLTILNLSGTPITNEGLKLLAALTNLERLAIDETQCTEAGLVHLEPLQNLESLRLFDTVTDVGAEHLSKLKGLKRISANLDLSDAGVIQLATLPHLEQLMLEDERITDASLASIAGMPELKWLWFQRCRVSDRGIAMLRNSETIEFLLIHETDMTFDGLTHLQTLPNLKILALDLESETDDGWEILADYPALEDLRIDGKAFRNKDVAALAEIETLRELDLDLDEPLDDTGIMALRTLTELRSLRVETSVVTDRGLTALSQMNSLEYLTLSCLATDDGLKSLYGLKSLRYLQIASPNLTETGLAKLTKNTPSLQTVNQFQYRLQNQPVSTSTKDRFFRQGTREDRVPQDALEDKPAPPLFVENWLNVRDAEPKLEDMKGKVVLVRFFGSWCGPCQSMPVVMNRLYDKYHSQGLEIIGVHSTMRTEQLGEFFIENAITWPVCTDVADQTAKAWKVDNNHGYYLLDRTGRLRYADHFEGHLEDAIQSLLAEGGKDGESRGEDVSENTNEGSESGLAPDSVVEVVAIGTHGKEPQRWWDADGNVLKSVPFLWTAEDKAPAEGNWRRIVIRTLPLPEDAEITWKINGSRDWWGVQVAFEKDKLPGRYFSRYFSIPNDRRSVRLRVGIATGPWKTIAENGRSVAARNRPKNKNLVFSEAIQTDRGTVLVVSHNDFDENFRVIAVDKRGKTHDSTARGGVSAGGIYQTKAVFPNLATKDVDHFEFQVRDYTWVETDDLPLQPRDAKEGAFVEPGTDQERVHSALPATGDKTGRLLSQEKRFELLVRGPDGKPVPQAAVEVRTKPLPTAEQIVVGQYLRAGNYGAFVQADEQGRVVLEVPTPPERFIVSIVSDGYGPYWAGWSSREHPQPIPARFVAELDAGWSVGGLVVDEQGEPIAGADVYPSIRFKKRPGDADPLGIGRTMTTDASGAWRFNSVPASKNDVHVSIDHPDYMPSRLSLARSKFGLQPDQPPNATIELKRGLSVTGHVTDADGQPIAGALVRTKFHNDLRKATTDKDGAYELKGCEPRMARIVASAKGKAVDMRDVRVDPEMDPVDFQMQPGGTVRIRVVDEEGHGIPKARIFFQRWRGDRYEYFEFDHVNQYTDENGVWEWNEAPHDEFQADICRPEGMQLTHQPLIAREAEYVFSPPRALVVSGHVIDARTKEPVKTFRVTPGLRNAEPGIRMDWIPSQSYEATDGKYRVSFNRDEPAHLVRIEADGYLVAISRDIRGDEGEVDVDFALQPAADIAATILTAEGQPAAGAKIALGVAGSQISIKAGEIDDGQTYATQLTADEQGRFSIPARTEAFQLVIMHPAGFAYLKSVDGPIPDKITLTAWARAEGTFRVGTKPAAGVTLSMFGDGIHSWGDDVPHIFTTHDVTTGPGGAYVFERVFPGRGAIGRRILLMVDEGATEVTSSLRVPADFVAGETTTLNLGGRGRAVIGQLAPPEDDEGQVLWNFALVNATVVPERPPMVQPPADVARDPKKLKAWWQKWEATAEGQAWVLHEAYDRQRWGSLYVTATVDRDGSFRIDDLPAGQYSLSVRFSKQGAGVLTDYHFDVPTSDQGQPSAALDLGRLTLQAN